MLPTPSKSPWFEQGSSFISLEDIMVGVQFTPRQRAFMVLRVAETHSAVQVQQEFRKRFGRDRQPLLRSGTISRSIVMKELAKIFVNKDQAGQEQSVAFATSVQSRVVRRAVHHMAERERIAASLSKVIKWKGELQESELFLELLKTMTYHFVHSYDENKK